MLKELINRDTKNIIRSSLRRSLKLDESLDNINIDLESELKYYDDNENGLEVYGCKIHTLCTENNQIDFIIIEKNKAITDCLYLTDDYFVDFVHIAGDYQLVTMNTKNSLDYYYVDLNDGKIKQNIKIIL